MNKSVLRSILIKSLSFLLTAGYAFTAHADYLPARMQALLNTKLTHTGPNCWNSALVASGILPHFRFVEPSEFHFWAESSACEKIPAGKQQPGDVQIYRRTMPNLSDEDKEVHANIWIGKHNTFNKMTNYSTAAYELTDNDVVTAMYGKTPEIFNFNPVGSNQAMHCTGSDCDNFIEYRRCDSRKAMALKKSDPYYSLKIEKLIQGLELSIQKQVQSEYAPSKAWKAEGLETLTMIQAELSSMGCTDTSFYCQATAQAVVSLHSQLMAPQPVQWLKSPD